MNCTMVVALEMDESGQVMVLNKAQFLTTTLSGPERLGPVNFDKLEVYNSAHESNL